MPIRIERFVTAIRRGVQFWLVISLTALAGVGQTRVDLARQTRNVDFGSAATTRPVKVGTSLPVTCSVGEMFFKIDAPRGQNTYACTDTDTWTLQSGGSTGGGLSQGLSDLAVSTASSSVLSVAAGVYGIDGATFTLNPVTFTTRSFSVASVGAANPATVTVGADLAGAVRNGDTINIAGVNGGGCSMFNGTFSAVVTGGRQLTLLGVNGAGCSYSGGGTVAGTGNGTAYVYGNTTGAVTLEVPASSGVIAVCDGTCIVNQVTSPASPASSVPLASVTVSSGAWGAVTDLRAFMRTRNLSAGTGISISATGGGASMSIDTALVPQLGAANVWTGSNDFSSAASFQLPPKPFFKDFRGANCAGGTATSDLSWGAGSAPSAACVLGHTNTALGVLQFGDSALSAVQEHFSLPPDWTGGIAVRAVWRAAQGAGNVVWGAQLACAGAGESADPTFGAATLSTAAVNTTANAVTVTSLDAIQALGCAPNKELFFRFYRDGASAEDTLSGNAELVSLWVAYYRAL